MQDFDKRSIIWGMFMSSFWEALVFMGKDYSGKFTFHQKYREGSQFESDV